MRDTKLKDAQRLLSRLITEFQLGNVESRWAKDLRYLVSTFVQMAKESDFEERLRRLEEHANSLQQQK